MLSLSRVLFRVALLTAGHTHLPPPAVVRTLDPQTKLEEPSSYQDSGLQRKGYSE